MWPPLTMSSWLVLRLKVSGSSGSARHDVWRKSSELRGVLYARVNHVKENYNSRRDQWHFLTGTSCNNTAGIVIWPSRQLNQINLIIKASPRCLESKRERKKTSMCLSWSAAPEVLTNLWWPVYALPPLIAPCISVWCESSHCSERPVIPQRSHTFIITLYCRTLYGHSAPNSLPVKNRAFSSLLSFWWFQF